VPSARAATDSRPENPIRTPHRIALVLALAFAFTSVGLFVDPAVVAAWDTGKASAASEKELTTLTNRSRASAGRRTLKVDSALVSIARWRSKDMAERDYFGHAIPPSGKKVFDVMQEKGYCFKLAGENIGWAGGGDDGAEALIHKMFLDSPTHRSNIMGKAWDVIGIGSYKRADGRKFWTVLFADKCGSSSTPKPKPKATPKPTAKPSATKRPAATPKPTPKPTKAPAKTPRPTASPSPEPTIVEADLRPTGRTPVSVGPRPSPEGTTPAPASTPDAAGPTGLRVVEPPPAPGLLDSVVGGIAGFFLGG